MDHHKIWPNEVNKRLTQVGKHHPSTKERRRGKPVMVKAGQRSSVGSALIRYAARHHPRCEAMAVFGLHGREGQAL